MYHRTPPGLLRDLASHAARRMLPTQDKSSKPTSPRTPTNLADNESLAALLKSLGYEVEVQRFAGGEATCLISRAAGNRRHTIEVELSPGTSRIWLVARIGLADLHQSAAPLLARLLGENVRIGPHFFGFRAGDQHLLLHASIENRDMTPGRLENCLERLSKLIRDTHPAWSALVRPEQGPADGQRTWCLFTSTEGRFRVLLPESPRIDKQTLNTEKGAVDLHSVFADDSEAETSYGVCYSVLDGPTPPEGEGVGDEVLAQAREAAIKLMNGRVLEERPIALQGHPGLELMVYSPEKGAAVARVYRVGDRFFQVLAVGENVNLCQPSVRSFLESFHLMSE